MKRRTFLAWMGLLMAVMTLKAKEQKMSINIHRAHERGVAEHGWLQSRFSFSFSHYYDSRRMGFGALRVINDDIIQAGQGFPMHPHENMEIVTIVIEGALEHRDSQNNHGIIRAGEIQYMSAGSGVYHSEYALNEGDVKLFQIWIRPAVRGGTPLYAQRDFSASIASNVWVLLVSGDGREDSIAIRQDARIYTAFIDTEHALTLPTVALGHGRLLLVVEGSLKIGNETLHAKDEIQITDKEEYHIHAVTPVRVILFDVPMG